VRVLAQPLPQRVHTAAATAAMHRMVVFMKAGYYPRSGCRGNGKFPDHPREASSRRA
jgi:hypothetical protein